MVRVRVKWAACNVYVVNCVKREVVTERYNLGTYFFYFPCNTVDPMMMTTWNSVLLLIISVEITYNVIIILGCAWKCRDSQNTI